MKHIIEGNIVFPDSISYGQLIIEGKFISDIIVNSKKFLKPDTIEQKKFIAPGFIDIQINGAFGKEFKTDSDAIEIISHKLFKFGVTSFCPTVTTSEITKYPNLLNKLINEYKFQGQTKLIGIHLEGPMLNPHKVGAQNASVLKTPSEIKLSKYINEHVRIVTFAPELDGSEELLKGLNKSNIKIGFGHSMINYEDVMKKVPNFNDVMVVHLFNAMDGLTAREPGLVGAALTSDLYFSVIPDGIHVHPKTLEIIWQCKKNKNKIICISDGSAVTGLESGIYEIGERSITKSEVKATLPNGTLVGSILTLDKAIKNMINFCGATIYEAVNTVTFNPASYLGISNEIGQIKKNNYADLVIFDEQINISKTFVNGKIIYNGDE